MTLLEQAEKAIKELYSKLESETMSLSDIERKQYNYEFTVNDESSKEKLKLQVYFGKKGIKKVIQGNSESRLYKSVNNIINDQKALEFSEKSGEEFDEYIGSDETGKGDIFGPLIVCSFFCGKNDKESLFQAGVKDSKELSGYQINQTAKYLIANFKNKYSLVIINPKKYNDLYNKFRNLNKLLNWAHSKAISNLTEIHPCTNIIVDKFSNESINITNGSSADYNIVQTHKGERYAGVAAASIIARFMFDKWFAEHSKFSLSKGASDDTAKTARKIFDNYGVDELKKVAKLHFKSISKFIV